MLEEYTLKLEDTKDWLEEEKLDCHLGQGDEYVVLELRKEVERLQNKISLLKTL